jgi:hypothetical protein
MYCGKIGEWQGLGVDNVQGFKVIGQTGGHRTFSGPLHGGIDEMVFS